MLNLFIKKQTNKLLPPGKVEGASCLTTKYAISEESFFFFFFFLLWQNKVFLGQEWVNLIRGGLPSPDTKTGFYTFYFKINSNPSHMIWEQWWRTILLRRDFSNGILYPRVSLPRLVWASPVHGGCGHHYSAITCSWETSLFFILTPRS